MWIAAIAVAAMGWNSACAAAPRDPCDDSLAQDIPVRAAGAPGGRAFAEGIRGLSDDERESHIQRELMAGNIPQFLRLLVPIRLELPIGNGARPDVIVCAAPDYLAIGSNDDFLLMPMRLATALAIGSGFGFTLPTPRIVDAIYAQAAVHFRPQPLPASSAMRSTEYSLQHNELIGVQRAALEVTLGELIAGDKKDLVLTNRLRSYPDRVAIYGWQLSGGKPIQPLSTVHGWRYADYSHGARLISTRVFIDGKPRSIFEVMQDSRLAAALSNEGVIENVINLIETLDSRAQARIAAVLQPNRP
jgi:hypothetical protein